MDFLINHDNEDDLILFTDGYDAFLSWSEKEIIEKYNSYNNQIVFPREVNCWPDKTLKSKYPKCENVFRYLCSGGLIGKAKLLKQKMLELIESDAFTAYPRSNQIYLD